MPISGDLLLPAEPLDVDDEAAPGDAEPVELPLDPLEELAAEALGVLPDPPVDAAPLEALAEGVEALCSIPSSCS